MNDFLAYINSMSLALRLGAFAGLAIATYVVVMLVIEESGLSFAVNTWSRH